MYTGFGLQDLISSLWTWIKFSMSVSTPFSYLFSSLGCCAQHGKKKKSDLKISGNIQSAVKIEIIAITWRCSVVTIISKVSGNHCDQIQRSLVSPCADHLSKKRIRMVELGSLYISKGFPHSLIGKEPACSAGDPSSIPGSGRSAGEGISYPLQYSDLENSMDCTVRGVTKSWTQLSDFHYISKFRGLQT